jgi:hypothetical protein
MDVSEQVPAVELSAYKRIRGHDGQGFNATLSVDGRKAAHVDDDGWGGPLSFTWLDQSLEEPFRRWVASLPLWDCNGEMVPHNEDTAVGLLVDRKETETAIRKGCKTKTLVVVPGAEPGSYLEFKAPISDAVRQQVLGKYPGARFLNDHLDDGEWRQLMGVA